MSEWTIKEADKELHEVADDKNGGSERLRWRRAFDLPPPLRLTPMEGVLR